jgi:threonine synthase
LHRCISGNDHSKNQLQHTLSPSMDIMVSSNFERMLFDLYDRDGSAIRQLMEDFKSGSMILKESALARARELFTSHCVSDEVTIDVIRSVFDRTEYLLDPHTAIGVDAARKTRRRQDIPMVILATAHPAKFPEAVRKAGQDADPALPHHMQDLFEREERYTVLPQDLAKVQQFVAANVRK